MSTECSAYFVSDDEGHVWLEVNADGSDGDHLTLYTTTMIDCPDEAERLGLALIAAAAEMRLHRKRREQERREAEPSDV